MRRGEIPAFNRWVSRQLLAAALLRPGELGRDLRASVGSERGTLLYVLCGEWWEAPRAVAEHEYTLAELMQHPINRFTYHRGQVVLLLRQLGQTPPPTDFRLFLAECRYGSIDLA